MCHWGHFAGWGQGVHPHFCDTGVTRESTLCGHSPALHGQFHPCFLYKLYPKAAPVSRSCYSCTKPAAASERPALQIATCWWKVWLVHTCNDGHQSASARPSTPFPSPSISPAKPDVDRVSAGCPSAHSWRTTCSGNTSQRTTTHVTICL